MDIMELIKARNSTRNYSNKPVEQEKVEQILTAAQLAPSWKNGQCWKFIVVNDPDKKKELIRCTNIFNQSWLGNEHSIIVACGNPKQSGFSNEQSYYLVDVAIAMQNLVLAATSLGLGTCWIGAFDEEKIKKLLNVPEIFRVVALTPLGYPARTEGIAGTIAKKFARSKNRKPLSEVYSINNWE